ncbi:MAG: PepSY domain-containing protein [Burkholderiaceae bacterium]|nr:PepSY domain-containing protein [Burkholderiaceae bacterium]
MKALKTVSVTFVLALAAAAPAFASDDDCPKAPREQWRAEADARAAVEALGYQVKEVGADDGCYAVRAVDKNGKPYEIKLSGKELRMVSRYAVKRELASR